MEKRILIIITVIAVLMIASGFWRGEARADGRGYVGLLGGVAFPSFSSNVFSWGLTGAYKTSPIIGFGPFFSKYGIGLETSSSQGSVSASSSNFFYGAELHVFLQNTLKGFQTGCRVGIAHTSIEVAASDGTANINISTTLNKLFFAPKLSYDYPLGRYSVGIETSYVFGIGPFSPRVFNFLLAPKFWF